MGHWARAQPQKARVLCPMALSYVLWPCPMSYGPLAQRVSRSSLQLRMRWSFGQNAEKKHAATKDRQREHTWPRSKQDCHASLKTTVSTYTTVSIYHRQRIKTMEASITTPSDDHNLGDNHPHSYAAARIPLRWPCPLSHGSGPCPLALSCILWSCPMSYARVDKARSPWMCP